MGHQNGRVKLFDARMSLVVDKSVREEDDSGNSAYTSQADASDHESPLCLPEQVFGIQLCRRKCALLSFFMCIPSFLAAQRSV
jgi:hypothetical protein